MAKISYSKQMKIIADVKTAMNDWYGYWSENITQFRDDRGFYYGQQWDPFVAEDYKQKKKPTLVIDVLGPFVRKMMGEQKNADVMPMAIPINEDIPQEKIDIINGLLKRITYDNHASQEFAKAYETMLTGGWGVVKIFTEYDDEKSFEQRIRLEASSEPRNVFFDPLAKLANKQDGNFCGSFEIMSKEEFNNKYPNAQFPDSSVLPAAAPLTIPLTTDMAVVTDYYVKEYKNKTLIELSNGKDFKKTCFLEKRDSVEADYFAEMEMKGVSVEMILPLSETNRRQTEVSKIKCYKVTSLEVLEVYDWYSKELPYVYIDGDSVHLDGRQYTRSLVTNGKDAQRLYNYSMSEIAHGLKTSRKEKIMMTERQVEGYEDLYRDPDRIQGVLPYKVDPQAGAPIPVPSQEVSQSFFVAAERAQNDISKALGMLDPVTGVMPRGASGVAVGRTINQQNLTVVNYVQNLNSAIEQVGRVVLDLLPKIYDNERVISIITAGGETKRVEFNKSSDDGSFIENDMQSLVDGVSDVQIDGSASFAAQKQMSLEFLMQMFQNPNVAPYIADLIPGELDLSIAPILKQRLEYLVPPYVLNGQPQPPPPAAPVDPKVQLSQMQMQQKEMEMQQKTRSDVMQQNIDQQKLQLEVAQMQLEAEKAKLQSATELETAHIDANTELMKSLSNMHGIESKLNTLSRRG